MKELEEQDDRYLPGTFWKKALIEIKRSLMHEGFQSFRSQTVNLNFFVPTYGSPGNGFSRSEQKEITEKLGAFANSKQKMQMDGILPILMSQGIYQLLI